MKTNFFAALYAMIFCLPMANARTWTVNNTNPSVGQYETAAAAMAAASAGDTLLFQPSDATYGNLTITKSLTFRGGGYDPIYKQVNKSTQFNQITIKPATDNVRLEGFHITALYLYDNVDLTSYTNNTLIQYCRFSSLVLGPRHNNCTIRNNIVINIGARSAADIITNTVIQNNVISKAAGNSDGSLIFDHNVFLAYTGYTENVPNTNPINNVIYTNNIFYNIKAFSTASNCTFQNNLHYNSNNSDAGFPDNGVNANVVLNNITGVSPQFTYKPNEIWATNRDNYRLQSGSPGKNAATDGTDLGVFGNGVIFSMTGEPNIPSVRKFSISTAIVPSGGSLQINMTASKARADGN